MARFVYKGEQEVNIELEGVRVDLKKGSVLNVSNEAVEKQLSDRADFEREQEAPAAEKPQRHRKNEEE